jgi:hypothetical protein
MRWFTALSKKLSVVNYSEVKMLTYLQSLPVALQLRPLRILLTGLVYRRRRSLARLLPLASISTLIQLASKPTIRKSHGTSNLPLGLNVKR